MRLIVDWKDCHASYDPDGWDIVIAGPDGWTIDQAMYELRLLSQATDDALARKAICEVIKRAKGRHFIATDDPVALAVGAIRDAMKGKL